MTIDPRHVRPSSSRPLRSDANGMHRRRSQRSRPTGAPQGRGEAISIFFYGSFQALKNVNLPIAQNHVTALIGPSGLRQEHAAALLQPHARPVPQQPLRGRDHAAPRRRQHHRPDVDPIEVRMRISMVFQKPNPFPKTIYENVAYGLRLRGVRNRSVARREGREVAPRRGASGTKRRTACTSRPTQLSGGQQQRLCIARALATDPEILLFDEPTSALDPIATGQIEDLIDELQKRVTIIIVTHNMQQAARVSDYTAFMYLGELIEFDQTDIFTSPSNKLTEEYITGRFG